MSRWKFMVDEYVWYADGDETVRIEQRQLIYGRPYYRISTGQIVPEEYLKPNLRWQE